MTIERGTLSDRRMYGGAHGASSLRPITVGRQQPVPFTRDETTLGRVKVPAFNHDTLGCCGIDVDQVHGIACACTHPAADGGACR